MRGPDATLDDIARTEKQSLEEVRESRKAGDVLVELVRMIKDHLAGIDLETGTF